MKSSPFLILASVLSQLQWPVGDRYEHLEIVERSIKVCAEAAEACTSTNSEVVANYMMWLEQVRNNDLLDGLKRNVGKHAGLLLLLEIVSDENIHEHAQQWLQLQGLVKVEIAIKRLTMFPIPGQNISQ